MILLADLLDTVLHKLDGGECPSPSRVALELMALLERPNASVAEAATLVRLDSVLTAKILELANSVLYRGSRPVLALPDAILRLGLRTLAHFVLGLSLTKTRSPIPGIDLSRYWARALVRALFLEELVTRVGSWSKAEVFTLGLLSDVGYLLLFCAVPESMAELLGSVVDPHEMPVAEQERLGINHIELTAF
jgi:HD-like signal output (HDOD) protein